MQEGLIHKELSHDIIGAGMKILNELKPGLDEKIYENALAIEIVEMGYEMRPAVETSSLLQGTESRNTNT